MGQHATAFAILALAFLVLALRARLGGAQLERSVQVQPIQALQPCVQLTILAYWAVYWVELRSHAGPIALHILYCYGLEGVLSWAAGRTWRVTLGVFPVVFSTNLFLYYSPESQLYIYALYTVAFAGKALVRRSNGRHIFNPSALGMSVMIVLEMIIPQHMAFHVDVDHAFLLPPNMVEVLFLISVIGQLRIPIVYTTLGAFATLFSGAFYLGQSAVSVFYPASFIAILLLVTDPRTSPRTPIGQFLYGATYGACYQVMTDVFSMTLGHDGGSKVLAVLPANLMVPWADRVGGRLRDRTEPLFRHNAAWVGAWMVMITVIWGGQPERKQQFFDLWVPDHISRGNTWIERDEQGRVTCEANQVFCQPFSLVAEGRMWMERGREHDRTQR